MKTSIKYILPIIVLIFSLIFFFIYKKQNVQNEAITINVKDYILNSFLSELPSINSKLPFQVDSNTTLLSIRYENAKIISQYELTKYNEENKPTPEHIQNLATQLRKQECWDDIKKRLIDADIELINRYQNQNKIILFEVFLNKSTCENF